jgi:outer membrane protein assembly factor BamD (BamD/ComL family)
MQVILMPVKRSLRHICFVGMLACIQAVSAVTPDEENALKLFQRGMKMVAGGDLSPALDKFNLVATRYPQSHTSALCLWEIYRIQEHLGNEQGAFEALNRLINEQPGHFEKAHAAQFRLVRRLLDSGSKQKRLLDTSRQPRKLPDEVIVAMLRVLIKNGPSSDIGIQAQYYLGIALEKAGEKTEARKVHEDFVDHHPRHELADDAAYQVAYIQYKDWRAMRGDNPRQRDDAALALNWFVARYPESDKVAQARSSLAEVNQAEMREMLGLAGYYESRGNLQAADTYYHLLGIKFPLLLEDKDTLGEKIRRATASPSRKERPKADLP